MYSQPSLRDSSFEEMHVDNEVEHVRTLLAAGLPTDVDLSPAVEWNRTHTDGESLYDVGFRVCVEPGSNLQREVAIALQEMLANVEGKI